MNEEQGQERMPADDWSAHDFPVPASHLTPEQILTWLDGWREFIFEVWKQNPELKDKYLQSNR